jgi:hypothetical protein
MGSPGRPAALAERGSGAGGVLNASASAAFTNVAFFDARTPDRSPVSGSTRAFVDAFATWKRS